MSDELRPARRAFLLLAATMLSACAGVPQELTGPPPKNERKRRARELAEEELDDWLIGFMPDEPYDVPLVDLSKLSHRHRRTEVDYDGPERPGTIVVDLDARHAFLVMKGGRAHRYGVGVGEEGRSWSGPAVVGSKARWPSWTPTPRMLAEDPTLPARMPGGVLNPLGARALYVVQNGRDTLFRLHGTDEPWTIGEEDSSGCIRFLNEDIVHLFDRAPVGTPIVLKRGNRIV